MTSNAFRSADGVWVVEPITVPMTLPIGSGRTINREYLRVTRYGFHVRDVPVRRDAESDAQLSASTMLALALVVPLDQLRPALTAVEGGCEA